MLQDDLQAVITEAQRGRFKATLKLAKSGMKRHPSHPAFPNFAAVALCSMNRQKEAVPYFKKALKIDPAFLDARKNLAVALLSLGEFAQSERLLQKVTEAAPEDAAAWQYLATARLELDLSDAALAAADQAISLTPGNPDMLALRSAIKQRLNRIREAIEDCRLALDLSPQNVELWVRLSTLHTLRSDNGPALEAAQQAHRLAPQDPLTLSRLAAEQSAAGQTEAAIQSLQRILQVSKPTGYDLEQLALLQSPDQNAALKDTAQAALKTARKGSDDRARIEFALAIIARKSGDFDTESQLLASANRTVFKLAPYDPDLETRRTQQIITRFATPAEPTGTAPEITPVFITGLPRSGTTLTEAMLGAHPRVCPMGERYVTRPLYELIDEDRPFDAQAFVQYETAERSSLSAGQNVFTDKLPENYKMIGFLKQAYPTCRIIHVHRDPRDVALSMWRASFELGAVLYTSDQSAMAHHFNLYRQLIAHWDSLYPGEILHLAYENMTRDPEGASRTLARHCGLDWTADMAHPDQHVDKVRTYTAHQLRQPVHQKSVGGWQKHAGMLAEFVAGLDAGLWPEITQKA